MPVGQGSCSQLIEELEGTEGAVQALGGQYPVRLAHGACMIGLCVSIVWLSLVRLAMPRLADAPDPRPDSKNWGLLDRTSVGDVDVSAAVQIDWADLADFVTAKSTNVDGGCFGRVADANTFKCNLTVPGHEGSDYVTIYLGRSEISWGDEP